MNSVAWRLPSVIVPVLSSSSMSTSPAASTARPDMASTLSAPAGPCRRCRSPTAGRRSWSGSASRSSATSTSTEIGAAGIGGEARDASTTAIRKMMVRPASRMLSAISFGVFCRSAPSTSAIMRSRKVGPGSAVIRTLIQSESTRGAAGDRRAVAAALADHRRGFAGDRGFVDRGDALDHLAVGRDEVAGLDQHDVADLQLRRRAPARSMSLGAPSSRLADGLACACARSVVGLRLAAAFGQASAKLANSTVNQSQSDDLELEAECRRAGDEVAMKSSVVEQPPRPRRRTSPGCVTSCARVELAEGVADRRHDQDRRARTMATAAGGACVVDMDAISLESRAGEHREVLDDRAEREAGKKVQAADDQDHADQQPDEQRAVGREGAGATAATCFLAASEPAIASIGHDDQEAADEHRERRASCCRRGVGGEPGEGASRCCRWPRCRRRASR